MDRHRVRVRVIVKFINCFHPNLVLRGAVASEFFRFPGMDQHQSLSDEIFENFRWTEGRKEQINRDDAPLLGERPLSVFLCPKTYTYEHGTLICGTLCNQDDDDDGRRQQQRRMNYRVYRRVPCIPATGWKKKVEPNRWRMNERTERHPYLHLSMHQAV